MTDVIHTFLQKPSGHWIQVTSLVRRIRDYLLDFDFGSWSKQFEHFPIKNNIWIHGDIAGIISVIRNDLVRDDWCYSNADISEFARQKFSKGKMWKAYIWVPSHSDSEFFYYLFHIPLSLWNRNTSSPRIRVYSFLQRSLYISKSTIKEVRGQVLSSFLRILIAALKLSKYQGVSCFKVMIFKQEGARWLMILWIPLS